MTRIVSVLGLLTCFALMIGCGGGVTNAPARINGKVTYKGAPVTGGTIGFLSKGGEGGAYSSGIQPDGSFSATDIAAGDIIVTVETESVNPATKAITYTGGDSKMPGKAGAPKPGTAKRMESSPRPSYAKENAPPAYVKIPAKYSKKDQTTLKATLKPGDNKIDFDLTD